MKKGQEEKAAGKKNGFPGTAVVAIMSVMMMAIAAILLFVPQIQAIHICYMICAVIVILGIYMIVRYFMTDSYRNLNEYGFSLGTLLVVLGICGMIKAQNLAAVFIICIGIILLFSCIIKLQYAMDLKRISDPVWVVLVIVTIALTCCSIAVLLNPFSDASLYHQFTYYVLLVDSMLSLLVILYLMIRLKIYQKKEIKDQKKRAEEEEKAKQEEIADQDLAQAGAGDEESDEEDEEDTRETLHEQTMTEQAEEEPHDNNDAMELAENEKEEDSSEEYGQKA